MASVKQNRNKDGDIISYRFRACLGRDDLGKQLFKTKTVDPPKGLTPAKALKQMKLDADQWENDLKNGIVPIDTQSFKYFVTEIWWKNHVLNGEHKPSTIDFYQRMTTRLIEAFGSKDLTTIRAIDIQRFLTYLRTEATQQPAVTTSSRFMLMLGIEDLDSVNEASVLAFMERMKEGKKEGRKWYKQFNTWYKKSLGDFTPDDLKRYIRSLQAEEAKVPGKPLSSTTVKHYTNLLNILFSYAEKFDLVERNPMLKIDTPKQDAKTVDFLAPDKAHEFIKALETVSLRWRALMSILINCGLRRGEVLGLQWGDVNFKDSTISVSRSVTTAKDKGSKKTKIVIGTPKSDNSIRTLPLTPYLSALLKEWQVEQLSEWQAHQPKGVNAVLAQTAYVFGSEINPYQPMFPTTVTRWLARFTKAHGLPNVSPHDLRHTCGSLMLMSGATVKDVQDYLGHEDPKTTLKFYAGTTPESLRKAADGLANVLNM
jgi:integrase